ncbi:MAG: hypothetical protein IJZ42_07205 [Lachnospiraceae bacterium]|nr:hypothetical protein [Lachnospiraceae bacterium]
MADKEKKSTYNYESQKKYNENSKIISLKFIGKEKPFYDEIEKACVTLEMSKQGFIKMAIREKLERDGFIK